MDNQRQFAIRAWLPLLVVSVLLAAGLAFAISSVLPKVYEAKATLIVGQSLSAGSVDFDQLQVSQRLATTYASLATKRPVMERVIAELGLQTTPADLASQIRADVPVDSTLLTISAKDAKPDQSAAIANAVGEQLIAISPAIQGRQAQFQASIEADLDATQAQIEATRTRLEKLTAQTKRTPLQDADIAGLQAKLVDLRAAYATLLDLASSNAANLLSVVEPAEAPVAADSPKPLLNTLLAAVIGLLLAVGVIFIAETRVRSSDEPAVQSAT